MPLYEYHCRECGRVTEALQSIRDPDPVECARCGGSLDRLISAPRLNTTNFSGRTSARFARMSTAEEVALERDVQRNYETLAFPPGVKHDPWDVKE